MLQGVVQGQPGVLGSRARLLVDSQDLEQGEGLRRTFHQAVKQGGHPVLRQEAPWECHPGMTASVIFDAEEQRFKAWYLAGMYAPGVEHAQCLAVSPDGITWERPALGRHQAPSGRASPWGQPRFLTHFDKHPRRQTQTVRLRLRLANARLYSYRCVPSDGESRTISRRGAGER
ncbi:MAG TPA: hypothetical protein VHQ00_15650 [Chloroflexota bacterium]|nr:hypothetical protein [Chloroflexota bacterium]